jgi:hypothetical protein
MSLEMAHKVILPPKKNYIPQFLKQRDINSYYTGLDGIYLQIQITDWLLVEVALLLIGLTHISFAKNRHRPSITYKITPCWVALLQPARRAAVLGQPSSLRPH